jgi:hypothetical protein
VAEVPEDYTVLVVPQQQQQQQQEQQQQQQQLLPSNKTVTVYTMIKGQRRNVHQLTVPPSMSWQQFHHTCGAAVGLRTDQFVVKIEAADGIHMVRSATCACAQSVALTVYAVHQQHRDSSASTSLLSVHNCSSN